MAFNPRGKGRSEERREGAAPPPAPAPEPTPQPAAAPASAPAEPTCHCGTALSVYSGSNDAKVGTALCDGGRGGCGCRYLVGTGTLDPRHPACDAAPTR